MTRKSKRLNEEHRTTHLFRILDQAFEDSNDSLDGFEQAAMRGLLCSALKDSECVSSERIDTLLLDLCPTELELQQCPGESSKDLDWDLIFGASCRSGVELASQFGFLHQWRLNREKGDGTLTKRKRQGSYYTPNRVVEILVDEAEDWLRQNAGTDHARVCDPACGSGQFLVVWLERRMQRWNTDSECPVEGCLYGVDRDPIAIWMARLSLWGTAALCGKLTNVEIIRSQLRVGDALLGGAWEAPDSPPSKLLLRAIQKASGQHGRKQSLQQSSDTFSMFDSIEQANAWFGMCLSTGRFEGKDGSLESRVQNTMVSMWDDICNEHSVFHWFQHFPEIRDSGGFDLLIGNPPFVNAIERELKNEVASVIYNAEAPLIRGSADIAYHFLRRSLDLCRAGGAVLFLLPRAVYSAPSMSEYWLDPECPSRLSRSILFDNHRYFENASIFVTGSLWEKNQSPKNRLAVVRFDQESKLAERLEGPQVGRHWWRSICAVLEGGHFDIEHGSGRLGDAFEVSSSMTTSEFYETKAFLVDEEEDSAGIAMVTTGAIDPKNLNWS